MNAPKLSRLDQIRAQNKKDAEKRAKAQATAQKLWGNPEVATKLIQRDITEIRELIR